MTPMTTPLQTTLDHRIEVMPTASTFCYDDYWGTQVTAFELRSATRPAHRHGPVGRRDLPRRPVRGARRLVGRPLD